jgi:hypothetical protein
MFSVMKKLILPTTVLCILALLVSGCATMRYPYTFKVEGKQVIDFKQLDDDKALKLVVMIYNISPKDWEDGIARNVSLGEYINLLSKRNSDYLRKSGIFEVKYDKINLKAWKDPDLLKLYDTLIPKTEKYYVEEAPGLSEVQNTERIMYLTALSAIDTELRRRDNTRNAMGITGQVLMGALTVALALL